MQARWWIFTSYETEKTDRDNILLFDNEVENFQYVKFQLEKTKKGKRHFQGVIFFDEPKRFKWVKNLFPPGCHIEKGIDRDAAIHYVGKPCDEIDCGELGCRKERKNPSKISGPWECGKLMFQGHRSDLDALAAAVDKGESYTDICKDHEHTKSMIKFNRGVRELCSQREEVKERRKVVVWWIWSRTNHSGKTRYAMEQLRFRKKEDVYIKQPGTKQWFQDYRGETGLLIDDVDKPDVISLGILSGILDDKIYMVQEGVGKGMIAMQADYIIVTANIPPDEMYGGKGAGATIKCRCTKVIHWHEKPHKLFKEPLEIEMNSDSESLDSMGASLTLAPARDPFRDYVVELI